jgi:hypothetical protein
MLFKRKNNFIIIKAIILTIILAITTCSNISMASTHIGQKEEIANYVIDQLSYNKDDHIIYVLGPIPKGEEIYSLKEHILTTPEEGFIVFIDLFPTANLHDVQYVFVSDDTKDIFVVESNVEPENLKDYTLIDTEIGNIILSGKNRRLPIPKNSQSIERNPSDPRWAVLMNGGHSAGSNHVRYWNDLSNIYITLNHVYNYPDENIIVLCSDGLDPAPDQSNGQNSDPDLDGDGDEDIMYSCVLSNVDMVFEGLANNLTGGSELFVFATDHGSSKGGWNTVFNLWNMEELEDAHFADLLAEIPIAETVCTFEPCFSGGFLDDIIVEPGPIVGSSACRHDEYSWAMPPDYMYDTYVFHWTAAVKWEDAYGEPVNADYNEDGIITMDEAFEYAELMDTSDESPQYGDYPEGCGMEISLDVGNAPPNKPQKPNGESNGVTKVEYSFSSTTTDPEGEQIFYLFNWGDNTSSDWLGPYNSGSLVTSTHAWQEQGEYDITVKAKDINGTESEWSDPHSINILKAPFMKVRQLYGGFFSVNALLTNLGEVDAYDIQWKIEIEGGNVLIGRESTGTIDNLIAGEEFTVKSKPIIGFGEVSVKATVEIPENIGEKTNSGFIYLFYIKVIPSGN